MRLVFMGTPDFAVQALDALHDAGHTIAAVYTRADTPKNRGMKLLPPPVKVRASQLGIEVVQPPSLKSEAAAQQLKAYNPDVIIVAAYGMLLPQQILSLPKYGCVNIHASLLPRWRGASPINAAILNGDSRTGVTIMQMDKGLDTGDMLLWDATDIGIAETAGQLHDRLALMGGRLIVEALDKLEHGQLQPIQQPEGSTYARQIKPEDCRVDFTGVADAVACHIRAYDPFPGTFCSLGGGKVKLYGALLLEAEGAHSPGTVLSCDKKGAVIACGQGTILLKEIQAAGGKRMPCDAFFRGHSELLTSAFSAY